MLFASLMMSSHARGMERERERHTHVHSNLYVGVLLERPTTASVFECQGLCWNNVQDEP